jgi:nucleoside-diphosphate-sugar epimerase
MFGKLVSQVHKSSLIPLIGDGSQIQFLVHQDDLCAFIERYAAGSIRPGAPILTAAHPQPWPLRDLLRVISRKLNKKVVFIPLPWRLVRAGLKSAEMCGLKLNFRSDSLVSLVYQNPHPDFSTNAEAGLVCRAFNPDDLQC